ncbi:hypothetical protein AAU57_03545 [Nonlabens sp. YIK11]|uniref:hypothetical protein n=1 Tax=Nonlabens sp. YIK11 TaxID=1453349 RepID=UPI0006DC5C59|nr:hypothetical protein [Nonlabens sp. YIK11]KQC32509.1 hypothetical protein AAU57_03545 [Nonlabens sp. YIK11]
MKLYLQFGYGMMGHCRHLIENWGSGTVILSPRDMEKNQMNSFVTSLMEINGSVIFDPQFYLPQANHSRLIKHEYWPDDYSTALFNRVEIRRMLEILRDQYNTPFDTPFFILPGKRSSEINDDWYNFYSLIIEVAREMNIHNSVYLTLCLSQEAMRSEDAIHNLLEYLDTWDVDGCYVVPEPSNNSYLVNDPIWIVNLMDLTAGIKLQGKKVVVGYSNHQMLSLGLSKVDAIASGTWLNVRSFNISRFNNPNGEIARKSTWYYCPQALSEYQIPFLDIAQRLGILQDLASAAVFNSNYSNILFAGAQPSSVNFGEKDAFRHYLQCLKIQAEDSVRDTYLETKEHIQLRLNTSEQLTNYFNSSGIRGKNRDFSDYIDTNLAAIDVFHRLRGMVLNHRWPVI